MSQHLDEALRGLPDLVSAVDMSSLAERELKVWLADVRSAQRALDGMAMAIAARSDHLAAAGGSPPAEEVMRGGGAVSAGQARRESRRAKAAQFVPGLVGAASLGLVSADHVDSIARNALRLSEEQRQKVDFESLVPAARELPPETFDRLVKRTVRAAVPADPLADTEAKQAASEFRHWFDHHEDMGKFCASLDPERYEALTTAVDQRVVAMAAEVGESVCKSANLAAQALVDLVVGSASRGGGSRLPAVTVIVDSQTLATGMHHGSICQTENGQTLAAESVARLCCDAVLRRVTVDGKGLPIDVGRKHRTATKAQWAALKATHTGCAWDGCTAPLHWCQAHHILEWEQGGRTDFDNLIPLCAQHHHRVHEGQWHIKLLPDRTLEIYKPDWSLHVTVAPPSRC